MKTFEIDDEEKLYQIEIGDMVTDNDGKNHIAVSDRAENCCNICSLNCIDGPRCITREFHFELQPNDQP